MSYPKTIGSICLFVAATAVLQGCAQAGKDAKINPYPFDTAKIEYTLEGNVAGTQTVYIKGDYASHTISAVKKVGETTENLNWLYVEAGPARYEIDLNAKSGTKSGNPIYEGLSGLKGNAKMDYLLKLATGTDESAPVPASTGDREIAGYACKMYNLGEVGEICVWNGIPLYSKITLAAGEIENTMTATSVQTGLAVDDNVFAIPLDATITDLASV